MAFISSSAAEFIEMYMGLGAARVRDLFNTVRGRLGSFRARRASWMKIGASQGLARYGLGQREQGLGWVHSVCTGQSTLKSSDGVRGQLGACGVARPYRM